MHVKRAHSLIIRIFCQHMKTSSPMQSVLGPEFLSYSLHQLSNHKRQNCKGTRLKKKHYLLSVFFLLNQNVKCKIDINSVIEIILAFRIAINICSHFTCTEMLQVTKKKTKGSVTTIFKKKIDWQFVSYTLYWLNCIGFCKLNMIGILFLLLYHQISEN